MRSHIRTLIAASLLVAATGALIAFSALDRPQPAQGGFGGNPHYGVELIVNTATYPGIDEGLCSLDEAINATNIEGVDDGCSASGSDPLGTDGIAFAIGAGTPTINITTPLPIITDKLGIDGSGEATRVELRGQGTSSFDGPTISGAGATGSAIRNMIINNFGTGIYVSGSSATIAGNYIGTNSAGTAASANGTGVYLVNSSATIGGVSGVTAGGPCTGDCNLISGNIQYGIRDRKTSGTYSVTVRGNYVGANAAGASAIANGDGIRLDYSSATIGGTAAGAGNLISGNTYGIRVINDATPVIQGNLIGTNAAGTSAVPNVSAGILLAPDNSGPAFTVGGSSAGQGNVISGNTADGVLLSTADHISLFGNFIGTQIDGTTPLPNGGAGIRLSSSTHDNRIGGTGAGEANTIAFNGLDGVIVGINNYFNQVRGNSIHDNGGKGIFEPDNQIDRAFIPTITNATHAAASGTSCANCTIDLYSDTSDEGRVYEGSTTADGVGSWSYSGSLGGPKVTATATSEYTTGYPSFSTSEFSAPFSLPATPTPSPTPSPTPTSTATATPTPTPSPTPTASPSPDLAQGDINCDHAITQDDFWTLFYYVVGLSDGEQPAPCPDIGDTVDGFPWGDLNCDGDVDATDVLFLLAYRADILLEPAIGSCEAIGDSFS